MSLMQKYCFSPNPQTFFKNFLANSLHVQIFISTFAIATINMRSTPHEQRARRYVQAQPTFSKRCGLIFLPITCRIDTRVIRPLFMRSTPHDVEMPRQNIRRFAFHVFFSPLWRISMLVVADEEVRAAFFVPLRQPAPERFSGNKATTNIIMQTSASIQRTAQLRPFSISTASVKAWLNGKSKFYTKICEFEVTRREVLRVHAALLSLGVGAISAESSILAALCCVVLSGYNVYKLNQEEKGGEA